MNPEKMEKIFEQMMTAIQLLQNDLKLSFLDAYIENFENINDGYQVRVLDGVPQESTAAALKSIYDDLKALALEPEDFRRLSQLILLKGSKLEALQPNHQLTPDTIGFLFVYLLEQLYPKGTLRILDDTVGMGNLLLTVVLNLQLAGYNVEGYGVDIDDTLLTVAAVNSDVTAAPIQLFHQDGLQDLLLEPVDTTLADLPVGFYPNDERAAQFTVHAEEEHTYAHHLLLEQSMNYVKPDGYGIFLVPADLLDTPQSPLLKKWLGHVYLQGMINLPNSLFKSEQSRKSILILQKPGSQSRQAPEVLLAQLGSLKDPRKIQQFFNEFEAWKASNL